MQTVLPNYIQYGELYLPLEVRSAGKLLKSVLIVDDSPIIVERLILMLQTVENVGSIRSASDHSSALIQLAANRPDLVLLDINLPGTNGIVLLQYIKSAYNPIIVIMITNQTHSYYRDLCKRWGADHFIDKSLDFELIPSIIASCR